MMTSFPKNHTYPPVVVVDVPLWTHRAVLRRYEK